MKRSLLCIFSIAQLLSNGTTLDANESVDLSLTDLLNISRVTTASKQAQSIEEAPAVIDIINKQKLEELGASSLYEAISLLPGIEVVETFFGRTVIEFRGIQNGQYPNKALMLVNGSPLFETVTGSGFLEAIPLNAVEQVEIIRGPGSSLYGTNAYSGVINIITVKASGENQDEAEIGFGHHDKSIFKHGFRKQLGTKDDKVRGVFAMESFNDKGYDFNVTSDEASNSGNLDYKKDIRRFFGNVEWGRFSLDLGMFRQDKWKFGITPNLNYTGLSEYEQDFFNLRYEKEINDDSSLKFTLRHNKYEFPSFHIGIFPHANAPFLNSTTHLEGGGKLTGFEAEYSRQINKKLSNISGFVYEKQESDKYPFIYDTTGGIHPFSAYLQTYEHKTKALFTQFSYTMSNKLNSVFGIRAVKDDSLDDTFYAPRFGVVYKANQDHSVKALFGKAFRAANFFEKYVNTAGVLSGEPNLKYEWIETIDLAWESNYDNGYKSRLNFFQEKIDDPIVRQNRAGTWPKYANLGSGKVKGVEFSLERELDDWGKYGFAATYKEGESTTNGVTNRLFGISKVTANAWATFDVKENLQVTPVVRHFGHRDNFVANQNVTIGSYTLYDLSVSRKIRNRTVTFTCKNIGDKDYTYPEYIRKRTMEIPGGPGRTYMVSVKFKF